MLKQLLDYNFWFSQPTVAFLLADKFLFIKFTSSFAIGVALWITCRFIKNKVTKKLIRRFSNLVLTIGLSGLFWVGLRFENTPIFSLRYWAGLTLIGGLVWFIFILKYWIFGFRADKAEYERETLRKKYLPERN